MVQFRMDPDDRAAVRDAFDMAARRFQECVAWDLAAEALRARHSGLTREQAHRLVLTVLGAIQGVTDPPPVSRAWIVVRVPETVPAFR